MVAVPPSEYLLSGKQSLDTHQTSRASWRTAIINQIRGLAREYGVDFAKSREALLEQLPDVLADAVNDLSPIAREELAELLQNVRRVTEQHTQIMRRITALVTQDPAYYRLRTIPGIGPTIAPAALASIGHAQQFSSARR